MVRFRVSTSAGQLATAYIPPGSFLAFTRTLLPLIRELEGLRIISTAVIRPEITSTLSQ